MVQPKASLLKGLRSGQPAAYESLVEQFEGPLFRFFACDHRDYHLAQEQTAETFAQLVRSLPNMTGEVSQLPAFIFTVARRIKQRRWRRPQVHLVSIEAASEISATEPSPHVRIENEEQLQQVMELVSQLESSAQEMMLLRYVEGYSIEQVSAALGAPIGTVKSVIHRSKQQIKQKLEAKGTLP